MMISVAMATYNGARYLRGQLDSLAEQDRLPDELVVCDDASSDETPAILEAFAKAAPFPVHVHRNERNLGYVANFGKALSLAEGELIFLSDQDDVWFPQKLSVFEKAAEEAPSVLLFVCDALLCDADLNPGVRKSVNLDRLGAGATENVGGACTAIRKDLLKLVLPMPETIFSHDGWTHLLAGAIRSRAYIDEPLQLWRRHGQNTSSTLNSVLHGIPLTFRIRQRLDHSMRDPVPHWLNRSMRLEKCRARLNERRAELAALIGETSAQSAIRKLDDEIEAFELRAAILRLRRRNRLGKILNYYRNGGYGRHRGIASALKDLVRRRSS